MKNNSNENHLPPCLLFVVVRRAASPLKGDRARDLGIYGAAVGCVPFEPSLSAEKLDKDLIGRREQTRLMTLFVPRNPKCWSSPAAP